MQRRKGKRYGSRAAKSRVSWRQVRRKSAGALRQSGPEHPRYERAKLEIGPGEIIRTVARMYKVEEAEVLRGNRGRENEARKVAMYLVRRCCDRTLEETAQVFGVGSYGTVGWASHGFNRK
jgi:Bacterial dnaA protein helix-turn-helix